MERQNALQKRESPWKYCLYCPRFHFENVEDFERHLRDKHSSGDGTCQYGYNGRCIYLFYNRTTTDSYEKHVSDCHVSDAQYSEGWNIYSASQILPLVLNDPSRTKELTFFTKTWGDTFLDKSTIGHSPYLPEITFTHFENYLKRYNKRYRRHCRLIAERYNTQQPKVKYSENDVESNVPSIFFNQILSLNNIVTFKVVFPTLIDPSNGKLITRDSQDELSNYLDIVEMQISKQVSQKSEMFFNAMLSNETIMEQMSSAAKVVKSLREKMKITKLRLTDGSLKIIKLNQNRVNMCKIYEKLKLMATVHQTQPMIQLLLSTSDYVAAVDLINHTQSILSSQLGGIHAFRHLSSQLTEMERLIDKMLSSEFQRFCVLDLNRPLTDEIILPEKDKLIPIVSGLMRQKQFDFIDSYKIEATTTIQTTVKQAMIEIVSQREESPEICLRGTAESSFLVSSESVLLMEHVTPLLILLLRRILSVHDIILRVSQMDSISFVENEDYLSSEDHEKIEKKLKKVLESLGDYCSERCASLISGKSEKEHLLLNGEQVVQLTKLIEDFTAKCEEICGKHDGMLNSALRSHSMRYIQHFHNEKRNKVTLLLENERWKQAEVPYEFQSLIDSIVKLNRIPLLSRYANSDNRPAAMFLLVKEEPFAVIGTVLLLVRTICEYCHCANELPSMSQYVSHCVSELLRTFNSRCCQLVLGAGALQSAGLKTITTSNLALVSRALQLVLWMVPFVKVHFDSLQTGNNNITNFTLIEKDINSHIQEIESKIESIAGSLISSQLTGWDARPPVPSQAFRNISKHLLKLHEALVNILPLEQINNIYNILHHIFKDKLREHLMRMSIVANGGPQHGVVTSELTFYIQTLKTLHVINNDKQEDNLMTEIWKN